MQGSRQKLRQPAARASSGIKVKALMCALLSSSNRRTRTNYQRFRGQLTEDGVAIVWTSEKANESRHSSSSGWVVTSRSKPNPARKHLDRRQRSLESFDDDKRAWRDDRIEVRQGAVERTVDLASAVFGCCLPAVKVKSMSSTVKDVVQGMARLELGSLPPNRYLDGTRREDLAQNSML